VTALTKDISSQPRRHLARENTAVIEINYTLLVQLVNFIVFVFILNALLYKPILAKLREREAKIRGDREQADELIKRAEESEEQHQKALAAARQTAGQEKAVLLAEAKKTEAGILDKARNEAAAIVDNMKKAIEAEAAQARSALQKEMTPLARSIAQKILGRSV
jgi:F-type H+-transporting ATPase subunit b